jgi:hypothetical protein
MATLNVTSAASNGEVSKPSKLEITPPTIKTEIQIVEKIVEVTVERLVPVDRIVEVIVEKIVTVERLVEVPVEKIIEVEKEVKVFVDRVVEQPVQKIYTTVHKVPTAIYWVLLVESIMLVGLLHYLAR